MGLKNLIFFVLMWSISVGAVHTGVLVPVRGGVQQVSGKQLLQVKGRRWNISPSPATSKRFNNTN